MIKVSTAQCNSCTGWVQGLTVVWIVPGWRGNGGSVWSYCSPFTFAWIYCSPVTARWIYCSPVTALWINFSPLTPPYVTALQLHPPEVTAVLLHPLKLLRSCTALWSNFSPVIPFCNYCSPVTSPSNNPNNTPVHNTFHFLLSHSPLNMYSSFLTSWLKAYSCITWRNPHCFFAKDNITVW